MGKRRRSQPWPRDKLSLPSESLLWAHRLQREGDRAVEVLELELVTVLREAIAKPLDPFILFQLLRSVKAEQKLRETSPISLGFCFFKREPALRCFPSEELKEECADAVEVSL